MIFYFLTTLKNLQQFFFINKNTHYSWTISLAKLVSTVLIIVTLLAHVATFPYVTPVTSALKVRLICFDLLKHTE